MRSEESAGFGWFFDLIVREHQVIPELEDCWEHLQRYRSVTIQMLRMLADGDLEWRPTPLSMSLGQQFVHIAQAEAFQVEGLLQDDWDEERVRLPAQRPTVAALDEQFQTTRSRTGDLLTSVTLGQLNAAVGDPPASLGSWLWFLVEHEVHHKAQISLYMRLMGRTPPFFAAELSGAVRPDVEFRNKLGGV